MNHKDVIEAFKPIEDSVRAEFSLRFFRTGPGEYGEGDRFNGAKVPDTRKVAGRFKELPLGEVKKLLASPIHEHRLCAVCILVHQYQRGEEAGRKRVYEFYLANLDRVNSWDLVDASAHKIVGPHLLGRSRRELHRMVKSQDLWRRRVAMVATLAFIQQDDFDTTLELADKLLEDEEDLIHKATGWMLREVGKRDQSVLEAFLKDRYQRMPRTMLRYAIEKFPEGRRQAYLKGKV